MVGLARLEKITKAVKIGELRRRIDIEIGV